MCTKHQEEIACELANCLYRIRINVLLDIADQSEKKRKKRNDVEEVKEELKNTYTRTSSSKSTERKKMSHLNGH